MGLSVYYSQDIRDALLAAEQATVEAGPELEYLRGYRAALFTIALAFGLVEKHAWGTIELDKNGIMWYNIYRSLTKQHGAAAWSGDKPLNGHAGTRTPAGRECSGSPRKGEAISKAPNLIAGAESARANDQEVT